MAIEVPGMDIPNVAIVAAEQPTGDEQHEYMIDAEGDRSNRAKE